MASSSFVQFSVHRINTEAPNILAGIQELTKHSQFLSAFGKTKAIPPRDLMRLVDTTRGKTIRIQHDLTRLAELRDGVRRSHLGTAYGAFASGFSGSVRRIGHEFQKLDAAIHELATVAEARSRGHGLSGDAAVDIPLPEVIRFLLQLLEFWSLLRVRNKLS